MACDPLYKNTLVCDGRGKGGAKHSAGSLWLAGDGWGTVCEDNV